MNVMTYKLNILSNIGFLARKVDFEMVFTLLLVQKVAIASMCIDDFRTNKRANQGYSSRQKVMAVISFYVFMLWYGMNTQNLR